MATAAVWTLIVVAAVIYIQSLASQNDAILQRAITTGHFPSEDMEANSANTRRYQLLSGCLIVGTTLLVTWLRKHSLAVAVYLGALGCGLIVWTTLYVEL